MRHAVQFNSRCRTLIIATALALAAGNTMAISCSGNAAWNNSSTYVAGNKVTLANGLFEAKWSTINENPSQSGEWGAWKALGVCDSPSTGLELILREAQRTQTLAAGEKGFVAAACLQGEAAISGGSTAWDANTPGIAYSTLTFDGNRSGWLVEYRNTGTTPVTFTASTGVTCVKGKISLAQ